MTNGEKIKELFPQGTIYMSGIFLVFNIDGYCQSYSPSWWNSEYKEPTTKNDLVVDAISRQALLNATVKKNSIWNHITNSEGDNLEAIVSKLPSVTPQEPRWIPVSERLPKIAGIYRVTRYYPNNIMNPNYLVDSCCFDGLYTWYDDNRINYERGHVNNIIAWQENPEPYEPQESEDKE